MEVFQNFGIQIPTSSVLFSQKAASWGIFTWKCDTLFLFSFPALTLWLKGTSDVSSDFRGLIQTMWLVLRVSSWDVKGRLWTIHLLWHLAFCVLSCVLTLLWVFKNHLSQWSWDKGTIYYVYQYYSCNLVISCTTNVPEANTFAVMKIFLDGAQRRRNCSCCFASFSFSLPSCDEDGCHFFLHFVCTRINTSRSHASCKKLSRLDEIWTSQGAWQSE